ARECLDACRLWTAYLLAALDGAGRREILECPWCELPGFEAQDDLAPRIAVIAQGSFRQNDPPRIRGTGYVVDSLEAALWAFDRSRDFREGALMAANLGDDADTTAAIFGQLAGVFYGESGIPDAWRARLSQHDRLAPLGEALLQLADSAPPDVSETGSPEGP
ncbi:MAG: ADP-ribosylglycohydrolase family protein, partial [Spiribacter salinus]